MNETIRELLELRRLMEEVKEEITKKQAEIMQSMENSAQEEISAEGVIIRYKTVKTSRIDTSALKKAMPEIAESFTRTSYSKRFTISA